MHKSAATLSPRKLESLRMLMDWQLRQQGYNSAEVNALLQAKDDAKPQHDDMDESEGYYH